MKNRSLYEYVISVLIVSGAALVLSSVIPMFWPWTVAEETFFIPSGSHEVICKSFPSNTVLTIYIDDLSGGDRPINFIIMDEDVYYALAMKTWEPWMGFPYYYKVVSIVDEKTVEWSPPPDRRICFVYINTDSDSSKTVYTKIVGKYYGLYTLTVGGVLLIAGLAVLVVYRQKSRVSQTPKTMNLTQSV